MFYNTTNETNVTGLQEFKAKAENQKDIVLSLFESGLNYSPSEVLRLALPNAPITSVRRCITDLTDDGKLVKTDAKRNGMYGRQEHVWRIKQDKDESQLCLML